MEVGKGLENKTGQRISGPVKSHAQKLTSSGFNSSTNAFDFLTCDTGEEPQLRQVSEWVSFYLPPDLRCLEISAMLTYMKNLQVAKDLQV